MKTKSHISFGYKNFSNTNKKINENDSLDNFDNWDLKQIEMIVYIEKKIKKKITY